MMFVGLLRNGGGELEKSLHGIEFSYALRVSLGVASDMVCIDAWHRMIPKHIRWLIVLRGRFVEEMRVVQYYLGTSCLVPRDSVPPPE